MATREEEWAAHPNDAREVVTTAQVKRCSGATCQARIWFGYSAARGVPTPFDIKPDGTFTGTSHYRTCPDRASFGKRKRAG